jgi:hypothetical protein
MSFMLIVIPVQGQNLIMVWTELGHGVDGTWSWCGRILVMVWTDLGHGVDGSWSWCGQNLVMLRTEFREIHRTAKRRWSLLGRIRKPLKLN